MTSTVWNSWFEQEELRWREPHSEIVALVPLWRSKSVRRVLDLGCGAGRHLVYLEHEGFEMYGADISATGLKYARQALEPDGLEPRLVESDMTMIPYRDEFFDAVISTHVIQHQTFAGMRKTIDEIRHVLRAGGLLFFTAPSRRDRRYGHGKALEAGTFIEESGADEGVPHHYSNLGEIETLLEGFAIQKVRLEEQKDQEGARFSHWQVWAQRE